MFSKFFTLVLSAFIVLLFSSSSFAQATLFYDGFEAYPVGTGLACSNPVDWDTWTNAPCSAEDALVSSNYAAMGVNSVVIEGGTDLIYRFGDLTSGKYAIEFYIYIPAGKAGYFNVMQNFDAFFFWATEIYFDAGGTGRHLTGNPDVAFTWLEDVWQHVSIIVDLDNDLAEFWFAGSLIQAWVYTNASSGAGTLELAVNDFFAATAGDEMYFDEYTVIDLLGGPEPLMSLTHTPGDLNVGIFNDSSIGAEQVGFTGPGVTWLGVNGNFVGGVLFGSASTGSVNGMIGSFSIIDIQNVSSNFAGGFTSDANFNQITEATVDDGLAPSPYGVEVTQKTYSDTGDEFVFIRYGFTNTTGSMIPSAVGGIFIDWDIDAANFATNSGGYTLFNNVCYQFGTVTPEYYFGIASLDGASGMRVTTAGGAGTIREESYTFMTSFDPVIDPDGDFRSWIGTPLGDIGPGETVWTTFAIIAGISLPELETYAIQASIKSVSLGWTNIILPVELTSFTANVNDNGNVILNWSTATELNNQMFEIERKTEEGQYVTIGYVEGHGTTTEPQDYTYTDNSVETGNYFYRLKQIDFGGRYEYSDEIEVEVLGPLTFGLEQNYPNPFNPSTNIKYRISETGVVKLAIYNTLGEEVVVLVDGMVNSGFYEITFDASNLPSGAYFYRLQSNNLIQVKKMLLLK
ncbi:MAG: T9SS type A sorting domain-containing protein [Bacteroidetes bacterium]|nr:T9SS type A sorting domain-containing protein [Bacteroidota bacterium]